VKTLASLIGGAAIALGVAGAAQAQDVVRIGTEGAYPPYNYTDSDGNLVGFEIDLGNAMCAEMGVECEWVAQDWDGIIPALLNGRYDLIMAGMSITEERKERIAFSNGYVTTPAYMVGPADADFAGVETLDEVREALDGASVGVQTATIHQNFLEEYLGETVEVRLYDTQENLELDLSSGRIDAGLADFSAWQPFLESEEGADFATFGPKLTGADYPVFGEGVGVGMRQDDTELREMVNEALSTLKENGTITELSNEYFGYDITMAEN
jgi:octopine/nopaline transport system substrate-binding protein